VELGETMEAALKREVLEETGIDIKVIRIAGVYDLIVRSDKSIDYHYVIIEFLAEALSDKIKAGSDALECRWVPLGEITKLDVTPTVMNCL